jgi:Tol biopolymer transport system component
MTVATWPSCPPHCWRRETRNLGRSVRPRSSVGHHRRSIDRPQRCPRCQRRRNLGERSVRSLYQRASSSLIGLNNDNNTASDVFVRNIAAGTTARVSVADNEAEASGASSRASISADGTKIAFQSLATNLTAASDTNNGEDVFVRDTAAPNGGATTLVSVALDGTAGNGVSSNASISADGTRVAFVSTATNLVANDTNGAVADIFVRDIAAGSTIRITGPDLDPDDGSTLPSISADGRYVTFANGGRIWVHDAQTTQLIRASTQRHPSDLVARP